MIDYTKEKILSLYSSLPEQIKVVYDDPETVSRITEIGMHYRLHIDQIGLLSQIIHLIILGGLTPKDFTPAIIKELDLSEDIANLITHEVNEQVFAPIRQELMRFGNTWPTGSGTKPLPGNVEPISPKFSSAPYQPERPEDPARQQILTAIENPTPTKMITRDNFADKLGQLKQAGDLRSESEGQLADEKNTGSKTDPYREPIA